MRGLQQVEQALHDTIADAEALIERTAALRRELESGVALGTTMRSGRPLVITSLTVIIDRLHVAGSELRRAEAHLLRTEGHTQEAIAALFGVTRQRVAALLRPAPTGVRRGARPR